MDDDASPPPGTDLVPHAGARGVPRELVLAGDLALGAGARAARTALDAGAAGLALARGAGRIASALPGAGLATRLLEAVARPLADDGARARRRAGDRALAEAQRTLEAVVPAIVELIDVDALVRRVDLDALLARTDVEALLARIDVDALIARVDVNAIADRIDVNAIVQRLDIDAVVEETELGTIVARSTSGFATEALDAARAQTVGADTLVTRIVDRVMRRRGEGPLGPPLLVHDEAEPPPDDAPPPPDGPPLP